MGATVGATGIESRAEARKQQNTKSETTKNFKNWEGVKYQKAMESEKTPKNAQESETGLLNFLF